VFQTSSKAGSPSRDKLDVVTQTNHLSHFLLTNLLAKCLVAAGNARVLNVSCQGFTKAGLELDSLQREKQAGDWEQVYNSTKLMNVLFTEELAARWKDVGVTSYALNPGLVRTEIFRNMSPSMQKLRFLLALFAGKSCAQGAQTSLYLACEPGLKKVSGSFFSDCRLDKLKDKEMAAKLWDRSEELLKLK
jgi:NAD(P)-dependent dehydrogenase (short-subunit alcohol dehydrogenase family)